MPYAPDEVLVEMTIPSAWIVPATVPVEPREVADGGHIVRGAISTAIWLPIWNATPYVNERGRKG